MHRCVGELDLAEIEQQEAVELYREAGDEPGRAAALNNLAVIAIDRADYQRAGRCSAMRSTCAMPTATNGWRR